MKVKKYIVNDLAEAMTKIKDDFGDDAYILETKKIKKGGFIGFGGKKFLEVTVLSEKEEEKARNQVSNGNKEKADTFESDLYDMKSVISNNKRLEKRIKQESMAAQRDIPQEYEVQNTEKEYNKDFIELIKQQRELSKSMDNSAKDFYEQQNVTAERPVKNIKYDTYTRNQVIPETFAGAAAEKASQVNNDSVSEIKKMLSELNKKVSGESEYINDFRQALLKSDFSDEIIDEFLSQQTGNIKEDWKSNVQLREAFTKYLAAIIKKDKQQFKDKIILVGPTGVGKTTTLAKISAILKKQGKKIAIVTVDTYRIAAADQLKIYADIMGVPAFICYTPGDLRSTLQTLLGYDAVLIDTAGRSHKNDLHLGELKVYIDTANPEERVLIMAANTRTQDLINIVENFGIAKPSSLIFTKIDETSFYGQIFSVAKKTDLAISYITTGQKVPDDINVIEPEYFARKAAEEVFR